MKRLGLFIVVLCAMTAVRASGAQTGGDPRADGRYKVFIQRNPFGLKDPPPPTPPKPTAPVVSYTIYLTGITVSDPRLPADAPNRLVANFQRREPNKKAIDFRLKAGESKDGLEVVAIEPNPVAKSTKVRVMENGVEGVYSFAANSVPQPRAGAVPAPGQPASLPGARGMIPVNMPSPQVVLPNSANQGVVMNPATGQTQPVLSFTTPAVRTANPQAPAGAAMPQPTVSAGSYSTIAGTTTPRQTVTIPQPAPTATQSSAPAVSVISGNYVAPQHPESGFNATQQKVLMELNRAGDPNLPPTPGIPPPNLPGSGAQ